ncbi:unnamed protein product [Anisakis simplex]|uniref:EG:103B4.3 protein (inferred by orthology to a D. melanogaster protein) n=1 Tax=Anisakis simplex TaxID=6269 RepID=A0A0M3K5K4_ANISI|nr:unnamed protein product [Anisakis simplex]
MLPDEHYSKQLDLQHLSYIKQINYRCAASHFATSVAYLMVTVGCIMGFGFGLMYCPAIVVVTMYFEKKRALATGMAVCGAGIGTVMFAPISEALIRLFSWRFVFIAYTGFVLMCIACGAVFRPLKFVPVEDEEERNEKKFVGDIKISDEVKQKLIKNGDDVQQVQPKVLLRKCLRSVSASEISNFFNHLDDNEKNTSSNGGDRVNGRRNSLEESDKPTPRPRLASLNLNASSPGRQRTISESTGFISVKDVFYTGSVTEIPDFVEKRDQYRSITSLNLGKNGTLETVKEEEQHAEASRVREIWRTISKMTDLTLLYDPVFLLFAISNLLTSVAFNSPLVFLPVHAESLGCSPEQGARVISVFGLMNTIGRILFGSVSDREFPTKYGKDTARNRLWIYIISLTVCGTLTMLVFLCTDFYSLALYSGLFGLTLSSYVCLTSVLLVDLLGLERLTNAFGLLLLFQGIGTVFGPPIAGRIADVTGNYNWSFIFCGVSLLISGLMLFIVPSVQRKEAKKKLDIEEADATMEKLSPSTVTTPL